MRIELQALSQPSLEQRLYEAAHDRRSLVLSPQDVLDLIAMPMINSWITARADFENDDIPPTLVYGLVGEISSETPTETWNEFRQRVDVTPPEFRGYREFQHRVPDGMGDVEDYVERVITIRPETCGLAIHLEGTGLCEQDDGSTIYTEFYDGQPRAMIWDDINNPDPVVIELFEALESNRRAEPWTATE